MSRRSLRQLIGSYFVLTGVLALQARAEPTRTRHVRRSIALAQPHAPVRYVLESDDIIFHGSAHTDLSHGIGVTDICEFAWHIDLSEAPAAEGLPVPSVAKAVWVETTRFPCARGADLFTAWTVLDDASIVLAAMRPLESTARIVVRQFMVDRAGQITARRELLNDTLEVPKVISGVDFEIRRDGLTVSMTSDRIPVPRFLVYQQPMIAPDIGSP